MKTPSFLRSRPGGAFHARPGSSDQEAALAKAKRRAGRSDGVRRGEDAPAAALIRVVLLAVFLLRCVSGVVHAREPVALDAFAENGQGVSTGVVSVDGRNVAAWQASKQRPTLLFKPADGTAITATPQAAYLRIAYVDHGYGRLAVTYKTAAGQWRKPDKITQPVLLDTGHEAVAYARCAESSASPPEIKVRLEGVMADTLALTGVSWQEEPFADEHFRYLLDEAWQHPYAGPATTAPGTPTLRGKVMVGYQGWFRTPNDPYDTGWRHWGDPTHGTFSVDAWPDVSLYPPSTLDKADDVRTRGGRTAFLFSPGWPEVVDKHFALMRQYGIDGAFVQRFVSHAYLHSLGGGPEWVLGNVRAAAHRQGRLWAVEYDVSGCPDGELLADIRQDWAWLVDRFGVRQDTHYAREGARPVVFVWGMAVPDRRISPQTADRVVDFLKSDPVYGGNYVIEGLPSQWRTLDAAWQQHFTRIDGVLAWQSRNYAGDVADFRRLGVDYYPHVWPGFSWANLKHLPTGSTAQFTPREGGGFYEGLLSGAVGSGADRLFVGMFDEYDEGTAILPISDDSPPTPSWSGLNLKFLPDGDGERPVNVRVPAVDLPLTNQPPFEGVPATDLKVEFEGEILPPATGRYMLRLEGADGDGATLGLGEAELRFDHFPTAHDPTFSLNLQAGEPLKFRLEYQHHSATGRVRLVWAIPGQHEQLVPASVFVDAWGRFLTNEGQSADHWLSLTEKWKRTLVDRLASPVPSGSPAAVSPVVR